MRAVVQLTSCSRSPVNTVLRHKRHEDHVEFVMRELSHRSKTLLPRCRQRPGSTASEPSERSGVVSRSDQPKRSVMGIWKAIKAAFAPGTSVPPDARRLSAVDELALSASLRALPVGERGWITLSEARALFSPMDDRYAFGEMDEVGKMSLAAFAAESDHRSAFDL